MAEKDKKEEVKMFGFGEEVPAEDFKLFPDGEAAFTVLDVKRDKAKFGELNDVNCYAVRFNVTSLADGSKGELRERFFLVSNMIWKISAFFTAIAMRKHGDQNGITPKWWDAAKGKDGRCVIGTYETKKGEKRNQITKLLGPQDTYTPPAKAGELEI